MKNAIIIIAIVIVIGGLAWYFVLNKKPVVPIATTPTAPGTSPSSSVVPGIPLAVSNPAVDSISAPTSAQVSASTDGGTITVSLPSSQAIAPDLTMLRNKQWSAQVYTGALDKNDTFNFNYATSFAPLSNPLAAVAYNSDASFTANACGASPTDCKTISINQTDYPFKITYGTDSKVSYVSGDYNTVILLDGKNVLKKVFQSNGVATIQGESANLQSVPFLSDLRNKQYNTTIYPASTNRYGGWTADFTNSFDPLYGIGGIGSPAHVQIGINNDDDFTTYICTTRSGEPKDCTKQIINKTDFPYKITYPDILKNPSYVSSNLRTIYWIHFGDDGPGFSRVFKALNG